MPQRFGSAFVVLNLLLSPLCTKLNAANSASENCNQPTPKPITFVEVPGRPFEPIPSPDGCWIFVSLTQAAHNGEPGIAVLKRSGGKVSVAHTVHVEGHPTGMVLTHDGKLLIAADNEQVDFFDAERLTSGHKNAVLGYLRDGRSRGSTYVNVSPDDRFIFVSDERAQTVTVIDRDKAERSGFKSDSVVGKIPVGIAPIAMIFSPDAKTLYVTSELSPRSANWPLECSEEGGSSSELRRPAGEIRIVDVARAESDPENSVLGAAPAGCSPVRLVLSPAGDIAYVTARNNNALLAFNTAKLLSDSAHARVATVPVGTAPVGVAVVDDGRILLVTNSNRFNGSGADRQTLSMIDAGKMNSGAGAVIGEIPAAGFPREIRITSDGKTAVVTNFTSGLVELIDLTRVLHGSASE